MKVIILFSILTLSFDATMAAPIAAPKLQKDQYAVFIENKYEVFKTEKQNNLEFKEGCLKNKSCQALQATLNTSKPKGPLNTFHPAATFCKQRGGKNLIAKSQKNAELNFCQFPDNSMITSWSLYNSYTKK